MDTIISDELDIDSFYMEYKEKIRKEREEEENSLYEHKKYLYENNKAISEILISSGFSFEGYKITKYSGYISGDDIIQVDRGRPGLFSSATDVGDSLMNSLKEMRRTALLELKQAAHDLGCNAVIGVDFDYLTLTPETASMGGKTVYLPYVFGVTVNGNAVIIEKLDE